MSKLKWILISVAGWTVGMSVVDSPTPVKAQGCSSSFCVSVRKSTGACDVPDLYGCNCACKPLKT